MAITLKRNGIENYDVVRDGTTIGQVYKTQFNGWLAVSYTGTFRSPKHSTRKAAVAALNDATKE